MSFTKRRTPKGSNYLTQLIISVKYCSLSSSHCKKEKKKIFEHNVGRFIAQEKFARMTMLISTLQFQQCLLFVYSFALISANESNLKPLIFVTTPKNLC